MLKKDYIILLKDFIIFTNRKSLMDVAERIAYRVAVANTKEERRAAKETINIFRSLLSEYRPEDMSIVDFLENEESC